MKLMIKKGLWCRVEMGDDRVLRQEDHNLIYAQELSFTFRLFDFQSNKIVLFLKDKQYWKVSIRQMVTYCIFICVKVIQAENQQIYMKQNNRVPRWKVIAHNKSRCKSQSKHQHSRFTPRRSDNASSENDFTLPHLHHESQNLSGVPGKDKNLVTSQVIRFNSPESLEDGKQNNSEYSLKLRFHTFHSPKSESDGRKSARILQKKSDKAEASRNLNIYGDNIQDHFKGHLHHIESIEREFQFKKMNIQQQLQAQQDQIESIKDHIIETFTGLASEFTDPNLIKFLGRYNEARSGKIDSSIVEHVRGVSQRIQQPNNIPRSQSPRQSLSRSQKSNAAEQSKDTFNKIFKAIKNMKQGLDQFKKMRVSVDKHSSQLKTIRLKRGK